MEKEAIFYKKHSQLNYWSSRNVKGSGYCKGLHQAKMTLQMIERMTGVKQKLIVM